MEDTNTPQAENKPVEVNTVGQNKIRVLALCDSPTSATGFAQVSKNVLRGLAKTGRYHIDVIGINFMGDAYDKNIHPYEIYPAQPQGYQDMYGRGRMLNAMNGQEVRAGLVPPWDIIFTIQDPFIIEGLGVNFPFGEQLKVAKELWKRTVGPENWFTWIGYFPVDAQLKENWVTRSIMLPDFPVAYCDWGKEQILQFDREKFETTFDFSLTDKGLKKKARLFTDSLKDRISVIPHGIDLDVFHPLPEEEVKQFRKEFFKDYIKEDTYLIVNVSRNQPRKDIARTMAAFSTFKHMVPNSHLYLHCKEDDIGGSINETGRAFGLVGGRDYSIPKGFNAGLGYSVDAVNKIYNAADLCITTTLGEGWGFITTEAMATKTPIIAPNITSIIDIFNTRGLACDIQELEKEDSPLRGIPVKAGSTSSEWICMGLEDNERVRPLTNVDDLVEKMYWAYANPEKVKRIVERGYEWVRTLSWDNITRQWDEIFSKAHAYLQEMRRMGYAIDTAGRNDPCPCGSGKKFKHCHGDSEGLKKFADWFDEPIQE